ncbi:hypothetical protein IWX50DRAFT_617358 [Phyllosticta citricarpa]|uniref:Uncharacterized protein n=1 Tax=Phyllosticta citricarpa TaxID=55181 RepID=A0ABR1M8S4_9PEZI
MASNLPRDSRLATWLSACKSRSSFELSTTPTPYSTSSFSKSSDFLPPFLGLLQCRNDIDVAVAQLERTQSIIDVQSQLASMRLRFQKLVQNTSVEFWKNSARMGIAAMPFEEIRFDQKGKLNHLPRYLPSPNEVSKADEGDVDEDEDKSSESEEEDNEEKDPKEAWTRFQRTRHMHILHYAVSRHRVGRLIANVKGSGSMILRQQVQAGAAPPALRDQIIAELETIATAAKAELEREVLGESGATEAYRIAMIAVLQDELRS